LRIGELRDQRRLLQLFQHRIGAAHDEDRPAAPAHDHLLARRHAGQIEINRRAGGERRGIGIHLIDQRHERRGYADTGYRRRRDIQEIAAGRLRFGRQRSGVGHVGCATFRCPQTRWHSRLTTRNARGSVRVRKPPSRLPDFAAA
jgi:hypothetical protein